MVPQFLLTVLLVANAFGCNDLRQIVGDNGKCLKAVFDVKATDVSKKYVVEMAPCEKSTPFQWIYNFRNITSLYNNYCLEYEFYSVYLRPCRPIPTQRWRLTEESQLITADNKCLNMDRRAGGLTCQKSLASQRWSLKLLGEFCKGFRIFVAKGENLCIVPKTYKNEEVFPDRVGLYKCDGKIKQRWDVLDSGGILNHFDSKCMTIKTDAVVTPIYQANCTGADNQKWNVSSDGLITHASSGLSLTHLFTDDPLRANKFGTNSQNTYYWDSSIQ